MDGFRDLDDASFDIARRGYDRQQVEEHLAALRAELARLRARVAEPGEIPGDGSFPDEVQRQLETVSGEVEEIVSAAREAAEGLRRRAAAEATRWREEAEADAHRWRSEAEEESARVRSEAEELANRLAAEAQTGAEKKRKDADAYSARMREEADAYSSQTREVAEAESAQARDEARTDAATWRGEAEAEARTLREEAESYAADLRAGAAAEAERAREEAEAAALETRTAAEAYSTALRESADQETSGRLVAATEAAESLRASVWDEATTILNQAVGEVAGVRERAENDSLALIAEGERQSHRLVSQARQAAEENRRSARIEAERLVGDAQAQHDEIIEAANRAAQAAQERAQALEQRREELMGQLEKAQEAMRSLEAEFEVKRETLREREVPVDLSTVRVVTPPDDAERDGVRVIPPPAAAPEPKPVSAEEIMDEVRNLREQRIAETMEEASERAGEELEVEEQPVEAVEVVAVAEEAGDDIDSLFANLRADESGEPEPEVGPPAGADPDQIRERLLLPVQNRALRHVKRQLTELQNLALEQLRVTRDKWNPDAEVLAAALAGPVTELTLESVLAGYQGARELGIPDVEPPALAGDDVEAPTMDLAEALEGEVQSALDVVRKAGESSRKISATVSKIFRGWRNDDAERRLREASCSAYDEGMKAALASAGYTDADWALGERAAAAS